MATFPRKNRLTDIDPELLQRAVNRTLDWSRAVDAPNFKLISNKQYRSYVINVDGIFYVEQTSTGDSDICLQARPGLDDGYWYIILGNSSRGEAHGVSEGLYSQVIKAGCEVGVNGFTKNDNKNFRYTFVPTVKSIGFTSNLITATNRLYKDKSYLGYASNTYIPNLKNVFL